MVPDDPLARRDAILRAVSHAASGFLRAPEWTEATGPLLGRLGAATGVHRIYVFENGRGAAGERTASQRFEWVAEGVEPQIENPQLQDLPYDAGGFGRWAEVLGRGEPIVGLPGDMPDGEREMLEAQGIRSILVVPIFAGYDWWGFMGFDECAVERRWSPGELDALSAAAGAIGAAIQRKRTEEALRQSEDRLRQAQKMEAIGQLAGGVAHDFNNLLTVIRGHAEMALRGTDESDSRLHHLLGIRGAAARAAAMTQQLLAFSRRQVMQPKSLEPSGVVAEVLPMLRRLISEDIAIVTNLDPVAGTVRADRVQLEQVVLNLVVNARDAMPLGGTITLATRRGDDGASVVLEVGDTGSGMDAAIVERIFEPFFTTKEAGRGTGLGLATVYGIVTQSGGRIECESAPGEGTTFRLHFPSTDDEAATEPAPPEAPAAPPEASGSSAILLVEDDPAVRELARQILAEAGFDVLAAGSGNEALELARSHEQSLDLILADLVMPGMSGSELVDRVRRLNPGVKVLYASGYPDEEIVRRGILPGKTAFLGKPYTPGDLVEAVRSTLRG